MTDEALFEWSFLFIRIRCLNSSSTYIVLIQLQTVLIQESDVLLELIKTLGRIATLT
jgi:hypothetical protein